MMDGNNAISEIAVGGNRMSPALANALLDKNSEGPVVFKISGETFSINLRSVCQFIPFDSSTFLSDCNDRAVIPQVFGLAALA